MSSCLFRTESAALTISITWNGHYLRALLSLATVIWVKGWCLTQKWAIQTPSQGCSELEIRKGVIFLGWRNSNDRNLDTTSSHVSNGLEKDGIREWGRYSETRYRVNCDSNYPWGQAISVPFHNSICKLIYFLFMPKLVQVGCMITESKSLVCMIMLGNQITKTNQFIIL